MTSERPEPAAAGDPAAPAPERVPQGRNGWARRRWALAVVAVLGVAGVAAAVAWPSDPAGSDEAVLTFAPALRSDGVVVYRTWALAGPGGSELRALVRLTAAHDNPATLGVFDEVLPLSLTTSPEQVTYEPGDQVQLLPAVPGSPTEGGSVLAFLFGDLRPGLYREFAYTVQVPAEGFRTSRLTAWAEDQEVAIRTYSRRRFEDERLVPAALSDFVLSGVSGPMTLNPGQEAQIGISGQMTDGSPASPVVLAGVTWRSDDPAVATVEAGRVRAVAPGRTRVRATSARVERSVEVEVVAVTEATVDSVPPVPVRAPAVVRRDPDHPALASPIANDPVGVAPPTQNPEAGPVPSTQAPAPTTPPRNPPPPPAPSTAPEAPTSPPPPPSATAPPTTARPPAPTTSPPTAPPTTPPPDPTTVPEPPTTPPSTIPQDVEPEPTIPTTTVPSPPLTEPDDTGPDTTPAPDPGTTTTAAVDPEPEDQTGGAGAGDEPPPPPPPVAIPPAGSG